MNLSTLFASLMIVLLCAGLSYGQIAETEADMSEGRQAALVVEHEVNRKDSEKIWKSYTKDLGKVDWDRKNKEHVLFNVIVPEIDREYAVTIITKLEDRKATFWFKMDDVYLNSTNNADELKGAGKFLQSYTYELQRFEVNELLSEEEKSLGKLEKDMKKLQKENDKLHKTIEKAKETIAKAEKEIVDNESNQESKTKEISDQKAKVEEVKTKVKAIGKS